ncbi:MAG: tetratricopeptide repeat protein [Bacteroidetes bacterium]|nr:tetratricopeptide repeat protein [Bacteroidota bacterium]
MFDDIAALEQHLDAHPASPLFARLAALYMERNRPAQALKLCLQSIKRYPDYPTGLLMIARAQVMLRQYSDARQTLRELLQLLPSCAAALQLLDRMTELELEYPPYTATAGLLIARHNPTRETAQDRRVQWSRQDDIIPGMEYFPSGGTDEIPESESDTGDAAPSARPFGDSSSGMDLAALAQRLEGARISSLPEEETEDSGVEDKAIETINLDARPVTETLVEIYIQQGRWQEAIDGYSRLAQRHPERRDYFEQCVAEVEQKAVMAEENTSGEKRKTAREQDHSQEQPD